MNKKGFVHPIITVVIVAVILISVIALNAVYFDKNGTNISESFDNCSPKISPKRYDAITEHLREQFNCLSEDEQKESVEKKYFGICEEIIDYCSKYPSASGCEFCEGKY